MTTAGATSREKVEKKKVGVGFGICGIEVNALGTSSQQGQQNGARINAEGQSDACPGASTLCLLRPSEGATDVVTSTGAI